MNREQWSIEKWSEKHNIINGEIYRLCSKCKEWKHEEEEFYYNTNSQNYSGECKECARKRSLNTRNKNIERARSSWRKWYRKDDNRERIKQYNKEYYEADPQRKLEIAKEFRQNNPDIINAYCKNRRNKNHNISKKEWIACKTYFDFKCAYCGLTEKENYKLYNCQLHKEHVVFDGENDLSNCVPSCQECNSEKNIFSLETWYNDNNPKYSQEGYNRIQKWITEDHKKYIVEKKQRKPYGSCKKS